MQRIVRFKKKRLQRLFCRLPQATQGWCPSVLTGRRKKLRKTDEEFIHLKAPGPSLKGGSLSRDRQSDLLELPEIANR